MTCPCCEMLNTRGHWHQYSPACLHCGARLIQSILKLQSPQDERKQRARAVLNDWMKHGHNELQLRALAKLPTPPVAPSDGRGKRGG